MTSTVLKACHLSLCVETSPQDGDSAASSQFRFPHKAFWVILSASLLLVIVALGLTGHLGLSRPHSQVYVAVNIVPAGISDLVTLLQRSSIFCQPSQIVRITVPDQTGVLINQSAVVDQQNDLVTFCVTSPANQTSTVLFDIKHVRLSDTHDICVTVPSDIHVLVFFPRDTVINVAPGLSLQLTNHLSVMSQLCDTVRSEQGRSYLL